MAKETKEPGSPRRDGAGPAPSAPQGPSPSSPPATALKKLVEENEYLGPPAEGTLETLPAQHDADEDDD